MPQIRVGETAHFFFEKALPQVTQKTFAQLANASVFRGAYVLNNADVDTPFGKTTVAYALQVAGPVAASGAVPELDPVAVPASAPKEYLVWLVRLADIATDSEDEIRAVMADYDTFTPFKDWSATAKAAAAPATGAAAPATGAAAPATGAAAPAAAGSDAQAWAHAIATMAPAARQALAVKLSTITVVPQELKSLAANASVLRGVLEHFFTYSPTGDYYAKWAGAGRDFDNKDHLSADYKKNCVREVKLDRNQHYLFAIVPESLFAPSGATADPQLFREVVIRFDPTGQADPPFRLATVHTARSRRNAGAFHDFAFFFAEQGKGVQVSAATQDKLSSSMRKLLVDYAAATDKNAFAGKAVGMTPGDKPLLHLSAVLNAPVTFPDFVLDAGSEPVRTILVPIDKVEDVAALPQVDRLSPILRHKKSNDLARAMVEYDKLVTAQPAGKRNGQGVLVGVIDSGIDGTHKAFGNRIVAVWDQEKGTATQPALLTGSSPAARHTTEPLKTKYAAFNWGVELEGADISKSQDLEGHGTHVSGIAAGEDVTDATGKVLVPAGLASKAKLAMVRCIGINGGNVPLAIRWLFQKADELGLACVINMSFGSHYHGHDGADGESWELFHITRTDDNSAYKKGRVFVAAAGNERGQLIHSHVPLPNSTSIIPFAAFTFIEMDLNSVGATDAGDLVTIWIKNPTGVCNVRFPLIAWAFRKANSLAATPLITLGGHSTGNLFPGLDLQVDITSQLSDPRSGDFNIDVEFSSISGNPLLQDKWVIVLFNASTYALDAHAWTVINNTTFANLTPADEAYKVGTPAAGPGVISVACAASRLQWIDTSTPPVPQSQPGTLKEISTFSSQGPLRVPGIPVATLYNNKIGFDPRSVDVTAPGQLLQSARSAQWVITAPDQPTIVNAQAVLMQGTSMASPVVTGLVANLLAEDPTLTLVDILNHLQKASTIPAASTHQPPAGSKFSEDWGWGLVRAPDLRS